MPCSTPLRTGIRADSGSSRYFSCGLWVGRRWGAAAGAQGAVEAGGGQPRACGGLLKGWEPAEGGVQFLGPITQQIRHHRVGLTAHATFVKHSHFHRHV